MSAPPEIQRQAGMPALSRGGGDFSLELVEGLRGRRLVVEPAAEAFDLVVSQAGESVGDLLIGLARACGDLVAEPLGEPGGHAPAPEYRQVEPTEQMVRGGGKNEHK